ncbi:MAG TPA: BamA/TamA family outer membrane protein [Bacteroidales bacterium]|mgnify:CR=1 FL=1|nr:BamA/TamA family outer membrane protein [Bacteroidales bacterium]
MTNAFLRYAFLLLLFYAWGGNGALQAQKKYALTIVSSDSAEKVLKKSHTGKSFVTKEDAVNAVKDLIASLFMQGFLEANIDSMASDSTRLTAYVTLGKKYSYLTLRQGNLDKNLRDEVNFKEQYFAGKPFRYESVIKISEKLLEYAENNGYPFAEFKLDSILVTDGTIDAAINFQRNNKVVIDSVIVKGSAKMAKGYLHSYLSVKPGSLYNESLIRKVDQKLRELSYVNVNKPMEILFTEDKAKIYVYPDKKKASTFYGILGVLPSSQTTGKLMINGELKLSLLNSFGRGELIDLNWRSISKGTQDLKLTLAYPYLFSTPFGINYKFLLYKQDTSYLTLTHNIGLQYYFSGNNFIKVFADIYKSDLLNVAGMETATVLPDYADVSANLFGLEFTKETYDYRSNPRKGYLVHFSFAGGQKKIRENSSVNSALYDSIKLKSSQYRFIVNGRLFVPLFRKMTLLFSSENGYLINNSVFENELYKLGGLNSLRGFDEESIRASYFNILAAEFRFLFERNSFLALFANGAYYEKNTRNAFVHDIPYGFGAGVSFDTKIGMFSMYYALGSQFGQAIAFKQSKIHFGYNAIF